MKVSATIDTIAFHDGRRDWAIAVQRIDSGRPGPTLLVMGGLHAGEQVGCEVAVRLGESIRQRLRRGTLLLVPFACLPASYAHGNTWGEVISKNQVWPGNADGNAKERLYDALAAQLIPPVSHVLDLHCFTFYKAATAFAPVDDEACQTLAMAADVPFTLIQDPGQYDQPRRPAGEGDRMPKITTTMYCRRLGKPAALIEFPGHMLNRRNAETGLRAVRRVLVELDMIEPVDTDETASPSTTRLRVLQGAAPGDDAAYKSVMVHVPAPCDGLFLAGDKLPGDRVAQGQSLGRLYSPVDLAGRDIPAPVTGRVFRLGVRCTGGDIHAFAAAGEVLAQLVRLAEPGDEVTVYRSEISMQGAGIK
ncbi:MAG: succinylglutamate desuccinylase/aspartoacylase family protein [Planctomycetota bacterium]